MAFALRHHSRALFFGLLTKKDVILHFSFGEYKTSISIRRSVPLIENITADFGNTILIADENTADIAAKVSNGRVIPRCILKSGEKNKNWQSVEMILRSANQAGLTRDCIFIGIGGGVISDLTGFAASIYKRGCRLVFVSTTLLGMVDASIGGKTGFDLADIKNLVGSFYPAETVYIPIDTLCTLPQIEWKSGMAELIKTAILCGDDFLELLFPLAANFENASSLLKYDTFRICIEKAVAYKDSVVTEDLYDFGKRMLLNLGHTFGHALESAAGLGRLTHGEAVAWGIVRACELGIALGYTPQARAKKISKLISMYGYECSSPHPLARDTEAILNAIKSDKKKMRGKYSFIVPDESGARAVEIDSDETKTLEDILAGGIKI